MEIKAISQMSRDQVDKLLAPIPFFKTVKQSYEWQYEVLLQHARLIEYGPGEVVLLRGDRDSWFYFLLKGQLQVFAEPEAPVNTVTPGEAFGDLAMLVERERTATVVADPSGKGATVIGLDFTLFDNLEDMSRLTLPTKLIYFRQLVHSVRWKLEVYRMKSPEHPLAQSHRQIKLFTGAKDTLEELVALSEQAKALAKLLMQWNDALGELPGDMTPAASAAVMGQSAGC